MLSQSDHERLKHILEAVERIEEITESTTFDHFRDDWQKRLLIERLLEIIGEAANHLSADIKSIHPDIPWAKITGMRNMISHEYFRIDEEILWNTVTLDIPDLRGSIEYLLAGK